jgi:hypothetical protein
MVTTLILIVGGSVTCGLGRNIFLSGTKEAAQPSSGRARNAFLVFTHREGGLKFIGTLLVPLLRNADKMAKEQSELRSGTGTRVRRQIPRTA